jgi:hypothetical protein
MGSHYRVYGQLHWASQSGNALLTLTNPSTGTKLLKIKSFEVRPKLLNVTTTQETVFEIRRLTSTPPLSDYDQVVLTPMDTDIVLSTSVRCMKNTGPVAGDTIGRVLVMKAFDNALALNHLAKQNVVGQFRGLEAFRGNKPSALERITVLNGEAVALVPTFVDRGLPLRVEATIIWNGSTLNALYFVHANSTELSVFTIYNGTALDLTIARLSVSEVGDLTTPFFQLVPALPKAGRDTDEYHEATVLKYDTDADAFEGVFAADVACDPSSGIPSVYLSDASAGSPKGVNYLHTKDFLGPAYAVYFPEHSVGREGVAPSTLRRTFTKAGSQLIDHIAPVSLRPGDSVALVTSAELATGTTAVALSGFAPFEFGCDVEQTDLVTPTIKFTGLQTGTKIALVTAGTETLVSLLTESGGKAQYTFTSAPGTYVDARILAAGYVFQQIDDIELLAAVQVFAVDQVADLVYDAGLSEGVTFWTALVKRIIVDAGNTSISVPAVYTEWVDWAMTSNNLQYYHAFENQGGAEIDPGAGTMIPYYCYLVNSWQVRPQEANHTLNVEDGILLVSGGGDPFVNTLAAYTVRINYQQPVQAITVSTGGGTAPTVEEIREEMDDNSTKLGLIPALL